MSQTPAEHHAGRILRNMELTMENIVRANNSISRISDKKLCARLREKNNRRMLELENMQRSLHSNQGPMPPAS